MVQSYPHPANNIVYKSFYIWISHNIVSKLQILLLSMQNPLFLLLFTLLFLGIFLLLRYIKSYIEYMILMRNKLLHIFYFMISFLKRILLIKNTVIFTFAVFQWKFNK